MTTDAERRDFDLIVLGMGPGGEEVAERMAEAGWSVLGIDRHLVGGECPYYGCIPSKMMIRGAAVLAEGRRVNELAGSATVHPDFAPVSARIRDEATDDWNDKAAVDRFESLHGTFVRGIGALAGRRPDGAIQVEVDGTTYSGRQVVVSVGTAPAVPPIDGLAEVRGDAPTADGLVWTNREAVQAKTAPGSLVVLGGGAIGVELAQAFARFGTRVTIVESAPRILGLEEPEASDVITTVLEREAVAVRTGVSAQRVAAGAAGIEVTLADGSTVSAEKLLVAVGRRSNLADVALDTVGLDASARTLDVDDHMQVLDGSSPVAGLFSVGDVTGRGAFTHVSVWQARVLVAHLLGRDEPYGGYRGLAWVTFTDPEVGRVGMTEAQARDKGLNVRTGTTVVASSTRGWIHGPGNDGVIKLVEDTDRGVLVGATVISPYGGEILGMLTLAVHAEVSVHRLDTMHYAYPTLHRAVSDALRDLLS